MINKENLNKMFDAVIDSKELTTKELNSYGFNSKDLTDLINDGVIKRIKKGYYTFLSVDDLFCYGKKLIDLKMYDKATACFVKCHELDPNHRGACFQLFLRAIQKKDYENTFNYFEYLYGVDNKCYNNDTNFYLYLLSMITKVPEKHREYVKSLTLKDIRIDFSDKRYNNYHQQNKIIISAFNKRFKLALTQLNESIKKRNGKLTFKDIIIESLLDQTIEEQNKLKQKIFNLIKEKKYKEIIELLENTKYYQQITENNECILFLVKEIIKFKNTNVIPEIKVISTNNFYEAVYGKNFELALKLIKNSFEKEFDLKSSSTFTLLNEIIELMKTKSTQVTEVQDEIAKTPSKEIEVIDTIKPVISEVNTKPTTDNITFATIIGYLMKQDFDNSFRTLKKYLNNINKSEYEFLIIDLIKISLIEKDLAFSKPMIALTYISKDNFTFDISEYIQNFYETLAQNRFTEARIYLDIIACSNKLGQSCILTESLEQVLNNTEKMLNYVGNNETLDKVDSSLKVTEAQPIVQETIKPANVKAETQQPIVDESSSINNEIEDTKKKNTKKEVIIDDNVSKFIKKKLDDIYTNGIVLLKPMDKNKEKAIYDIVDGISDVVAFTIDTDEGKQIVLRAKPYIYEHLDFQALIKEGNDAYKTGDYNSCIDCYNKLLQFGNLKASVYAKLGLAYMKKYKKDIAIDYLTIATSLAKNEKTDFDFTELIESLKGLINIEDKKTKFKMDAEEFENDTENYYGLENIFELSELINSGMNIDKACAELGLDDEQKAIAILIIAREYYSQENYSAGDTYLKKVEKMKNKTKFVSSLFEEIRKNKKFYKNRVSKDHKTLLLSLKTNK